MKFILISSILALSTIMAGFDSFKLTNNLKISEAFEFNDEASADTIPVKSEDPMQQLFDAVDKMERKLESLGKQHSQDSLNTSGDSVKSIFIELERTIKHVEEEITKSFKPKQDSLSQQQNALENAEVDTLMH
jgi:hypothetical protein